VPSRPSKKNADARSWLRGERRVVPLRSPEDGEEGEGKKATILSMILQGRRSCSSIRRGKKDCNQKKNGKKRRRGPCSGTDSVCFVEGDGSFRNFFHLVERKTSRAQRTPQVNK